MKKILSATLIVFLVLISVNIKPVNAFGGEFNASNIQNKDNSGNLGTLKTPVSRLAATVFLLLQVAAVGGVIVIGIKYMYSSAEKKATYKQILFPVIVGGILVFCASTVASFVTKVFTDVTQ